MDFVILGFMGLVVLFIGLKTKAQKGSNDKAGDCG